MSPFADMPRARARLQRQRQNRKMIEKMMTNATIDAGMPLPLQVSSREAQHDPSHYPWLIRSPVDNTEGYLHIYHYY